MKSNIITCKAVFLKDGTVVNDMEHLDYGFDINEVFAWNQATMKNHTTLWFKNGESIAVDIPFKDFTILKETYSQFFPYLDKSQNSLTPF